MALTAINPTKKVVVPGRQTKTGGLGGLLQAAGTVAGGIAGAVTTAGNPAAITGGAVSGGSLGATLEQGINPGRQGKQQQEEFNPTVNLSARDESARSQQLLDGLRAAQGNQSLAEYTAPITKAYIQSTLNLQKMG